MLKLNPETIEVESSCAEVRIGCIPHACLLTRYLKARVMGTAVGTAWLPGS